MMGLGQRILTLFQAKNPMVPALIVADLGLNNNTQIVQVLAEGQQYLAVYLPALAVQVPGNCFVARMNAGRLAVAAVVATNYQVMNYLGGWGSGDGTSPGGTGPGNGGPGSPGGPGTGPGGGDPRPPIPGDPGTGTPGPGEPPSGPITVVPQSGWGNFPWGYP